LKIVCTGKILIRVRNVEQKTQRTSKLLIANLKIHRKRSDTKNGIGGRFNWNNGVRLSLSLYHSLSLFHTHTHTHICRHTQNFLSFLWKKLFLILTNCKLSSSNIKNFKLEIRKNVISKYLYSLLL
jgi:hypothetical protein